MNEKFDHIFRNIAQEHESPFEPAEWENFKKLLENNTPNAPAVVPFSTPANPFFSYKKWAKTPALALLMYLLPQHLGNYYNHFNFNAKENFTAKSSFGNNFNLLENTTEQKLENTNQENNQPNIQQQTKENIEQKPLQIQHNQKNNTNSQTLPVNNTKENFVMYAKETKKNTENTTKNLENTQIDITMNNIQLATLKTIEAKQTEFHLANNPEILPIETQNNPLQKSPNISVKAVATPTNTRHATHNIGLMNFASAKGVQIALFSNQNTFVTPQKNVEDMPIFEKRKFKAQISSLMNLNSNDYQNLQLSFLFNGACNVKGLQMATFNGAGELEGMQIGIVNVAKNLKGTQFGIINVVDSVKKGTPIGLLNIVKYGGYQKLEISTGDVFQTNILGKIGIKKFYTIFSVATGYGIAKDFRWALGYGAGKEITISKKSAFNTEFMAYHVNEETRFTRELNLLTQFKLQYNLQIFKGTNIYFGPTLNTMFSDFRNADMTLGSQIAPYVMYQDKIKNSETSVKMWLGGNIGISF